MTAIVPVALPLIFGRLLLVGFDNHTCYHLIWSGLQWLRSLWQRAGNMAAWCWQLNDACGHHHNCMTLGSEQKGWIFAGCNLQKPCSQTSFNYE